MLDLLHQQIGILRLRELHLEFIPQPLPGSRKIKVMSLNGKAVHERDFATRGMPGVRPVAGFEQHGAQQADLNYFADHAVDLYPIADSDSVSSHQHEPSKKSDDRSEEHTSELQSPCNLVCR